MSTDKYILNEAGEPELTDDLLAWGKWLQDSEARIVKQDEKDGVKVSTVFLGLDHQYGDGPPLFWETMIFGGKHDQYQKRYSTREEAVAGHAEALRMAMT